MVGVSVETRLFGLVIPTQSCTSESPLEHLKLPGLGPPPLEILIQEVWCGAQEIHVQKKLFNHCIAFPGEKPPKWEGIATVCFSCSETWV